MLKSTAKHSLLGDYTQGITQPHGLRRLHSRVCLCMGKKMNSKIVKYMWPSVHMHRHCSPLHINTTTVMLKYNP